MREFDFEIAFSKPEEDQTIWQVPLEPLVVEGGKKSIKHGVLLTDREDTLEIQDVKNATYKLNAETCGVCECSLSLLPSPA